MDTPEELTQSQYALLAVLSVEPMSGYDIRGFLESIGGFWSESYGQIYPNLRSLHQLGLISKEADRGKGRRRRHVHSLTDEGIGRLRRWLAEPAWLGPPPRLELLLKLFFGSEVGPAVSTQQVTRYRTFLAGLLGEYREIEEWLNRELADHPHLPYRLLTVHCGIRSATAMIEWCDESLDVLRNLDESPAPGRP